MPPQFAGRTRNQSPPPGEEAPENSSDPSGVLLFTHCWVASWKLPVACRIPRLPRTTSNPVAPGTVAQESETSAPALTARRCGAPAGGWGAGTQRHWVAMWKAVIVLAGSSAPGPLSAEDEANEIQPRFSDQA